MKLRYTPIKNYVSSAEAVITYCGLTDRVEPVPTRPFDNDDIWAANPLGTVPTLIRDDGSALYGGPVLYAYLDTLHDRPRLMGEPDSDRHWDIWRRTWLGDGLFDAQVKLILESWEPVETHRQGYVDRVWRKITLGLDQCERDAPGFGDMDMGQLRVMGALAFMNTKLSVIAEKMPMVDGSYDWRAGRPALSAWYDRWADDPMFTTNLIPQTD